jgi:hypothetical protein
MQNKTPLFDYQSSPLVSHLVYTKLSGGLKSKIYNLLSINYILLLKTENKLIKIDHGN